MQISNEGLQRLAQDEGFRGDPYEDHLGKPTIGYGTLLPLTEAEAALLLNHRLQEKLDELTAAAPWVEGLPQPVQDVLANMAYQLGVGGLMKFRNFLNALQMGNYASAKPHGLDSLWARQTPNRANRLMDQLATLA